MVVNSFTFLIFFTIVFFLYYFPLKEKTKAQNWLLLLSSYFFYGFADWKMIPLLLSATIIFYGLGIVIHKTSNSKKSSGFTTLGVLSAIGILVYFKYFNFFIDSFASLLNNIGLKANIGTFNIIMPLGISFFTFKLVSYVIEINRGKIEPSRDFVAFSTYIAFFPTILSGPIDRPNSFIPQLQKKRIFDNNIIVDGCRQILWGLFQKMVIADNLAVIINRVWGDIPNQSGSILLITAILYSVQMYTDFSGYSDMAIGVGKILGFRITKNFNYPYFSRNVAEYWRNWHISLTSWLTDYIFMPLNIKFRYWGNFGIILAIIINMIAVGMWHGANWTFAVFGLYHGLLFIPLILSGSFYKNKKLKANKNGLPSLIDFSKILGTFMLVTLGLVIFRGENIGQVWLYLLSTCSKSLFSISILELKAMSAGIEIIYIIVFILGLFILEWIQRDKEFALQFDGTKFSIFLRWSFYYGITIIIMYFSGVQTQFIYFQF